MINNDVKRKEKRKIQLKNGFKKSKLELKFKTKRMSKGELSSRKKIDYGMKDGSMEERNTSLFENVKVSCVFIDIRTITLQSQSMIPTLFQQT